MSRANNQALAKGAEAIRKAEAGAKAQGLDPHPLALMFPSLDGDAINALADDIKANGLQNAVIIHEGRILDGLQRYEACRRIGIRPMIQEFMTMGAAIVKAGPLAYVISQNLHRRHLTTQQRADIAAKLTNLRDGSNRHEKKVALSNDRATTEPEIEKPVTVKQAAEMLEVSEASVNRARKRAGKTKPKFAMAQRQRTAPRAPSGEFTLLYADPPWQYEAGCASPRNSIERQYATVSSDALCAMKVPCADNAVLFLWTPVPKMIEAANVMTAWGFEYRTGAVWVKPSIGLGYYFRQQHELLLVGVHGKIRPPVVEGRASSVISAPRGRHSEKPGIVYELLEKMYPDLGEADRIELFARQKREGWSAWGNEL
jgi:N6-adenosine-specific RNA methylase IME4